MQELISVIVPIYKVEKYLDACIESIVNQTYGNLEIILVDDGSPDNCPAMCDAWAEKDSRIKVIHKKNGGQGEARNFALDIASGRYIGFVDSDDKISPAMYEKLLELLSENDADAVQCAMLNFSDPDQTVFPVLTVEPKCEILDREKAVRYLLADRITSTCPNTLLRKELAEKVRFDTGIINEDVMWIYRVLKYSRKTVITDEQLYYYLQRDGSTMNSKYSSKRFDALDATLLKADSIKDDFPSLYPLALRNYVGSCMYHYQMLCRLPKNDEYKSFKEKIHKRFCETDLSIVAEATGLKYRIWHRAFKLFPDITCKIRNLLKIGL